MSVLSSVDQIDEHLCGMIARINLVVDTGDFACFVDQNTDPLRIPRLHVVTRAVRHPESSLGVAQDRKVVVVLLREGGVLRDAVEARPEHRNILLIEVGFLVAEPATFDGSARCIGLGIEPDQNLMAAQILKRHDVPLMGLQAELRGDISCLDRHR